MTKATLVSIATVKAAADESVRLAAQAVLQHARNRDCLYGANWWKREDLLSSDWIYRKSARKSKNQILANVSEIIPLETFRYEPMQLKWPGRETLVAFWNEPISALQDDNVTKILVTLSGVTETGILNSHGWCGYIGSGGTIIFANGRAVRVTGKCNFTESWQDGVDITPATELRG